MNGHPDAGRVLTSTTHPSSSDAPIDVASSGPSFDFPFIGDIADIQLYNVCLTPQEVAELAGTSGPVSIPGCDGGGN